MLGTDKNCHRPTVSESDDCHLTLTLTLSLTLVLLTSYTSSVLYITADHHIYDTLNERMRLHERIALATRNYRCFHAEDQHPLGINWLRR